MASYMKNREYLSLVLGQILYFASHFFAWAIFPVLIVASGFELVELVWFYAIVFMTTIVSLLTVSKQETRWTMIRGLIIKALMLLFLFKLVWSWQLWIVAVMYGFFWAFYWVTYNVRYYQLTTQGGTAFASSLTSSIAPMVSIVIPTLSGAIVVSTGFYMSFLISIGLMIVAFFAFRKLPTQHVEYDISKGLMAVTRLRRLLFIEGFWETSYYICIPLITLEFLKSGLSYGAFLSYIGIVGVFASFVSGKLADKFANRSIFIYPATIFVAGFTIVAAFTDNLWSWTIVVGLFSFFRAMASPLMMTVLVDCKGDLVDSMLAREFLLAVGRLAGTLLILAVYYTTGDVSWALLIIGIVSTTYPLVLFNTKVYEEMDKKMRFATKDRFSVMLRVWFLSPMMFFPNKIRNRWDSVRVFWSELKINRILKR